MTSRQSSSVGSRSTIRMVLFDFDGTLNARHTGGAVFVKRANDDCYVQHGQGEQLFSKNVASKNAEWTFALLYDLVVKQRVCVGIVTMADAKHGKPLQTLLNDSPRTAAEWKVVAGGDLVLCWLRSLAASCCDGKTPIADALVKEMFDSGLFFVDAQFNTHSKREHVQRAVTRFNALVAATGTTAATCNLRNDQILYVEDTAALLDDVQAGFPGLHGVLVANGGLTKEIWQIVEECHSLEPAVP